MPYSRTVKASCHMRGTSMPCCQLLWNSSGLQGMLPECLQLWLLTWYTALASMLSRSVIHIHHLSRILSFMSYSYELLICAGLRWQPAQAYCCWLCCYTHLGDSSAAGSQTAANRMLRSPLRKWL